MMMMKHTNLYELYMVTAMHDDTSGRNALKCNTNTAFKFEMSKINTKIWLMCCDLLHKNFMLYAHFGKELPLGVEKQVYASIYIKYSKICFCPLLKLMDSCIYIMFPVPSIYTIICNIGILYTQNALLLFYC